MKSGQLLTVFQRKQLEKSISRDNLPEQYRLRIAIILLADEGKHQSEICQALGCAQGTARHWILMARSGQAHNWNDNPVGRPQKVNEQFLERLKELVNQNPKEVRVPDKEYTYPTSRWTAKRLSSHLKAELGIALSDRHINRLLKNMGLSTRLKLVNAEENSRVSAISNIVIRDLPSPSTVEAFPSSWSFHSLGL